MQVELDAGTAGRRRLDLRLRPGGLRLPVHGPGQHRRRQLRPGDRQRPVDLRAGPDRAASRASRRRSSATSASTPDFEQGKHYLEANDSAGNTFKATAKPVLIGTAVVGATTMIFSIILLLGKDGPAAPEPDRRPGAARLHLRRRGDLLVLRRLDAGRDHRRLPGRRVHQEEHGPRPRRRPTSRIRRRSSASAPSTPRAGMWNIFIALMTITLAFAFFDPELLRGLPDLDRRVRPVPGDLHGQRRRRVGQRQEAGRSRSEGKGHAAARRHGHRRHGRRSVQGHDLGRARIRSSSSRRCSACWRWKSPSTIKAAAARSEGTTDYTPYVGVVMLAIALIFVWRSFYAMRIPEREGATAKAH